MVIEELPDLLIIGGLFLSGWAAHVVGSFTHIPRVTLLLSVGILAGPMVLDLVPQPLTQYFPTVSHLALAMIGFLLGESFAGRDIKADKRQVLLISLGASLIPAITVFGFVYLVSSDLILALVLAGIATATDPAATMDVIRETRIEGPLPSMLKGVVAIDDAWGVIIFSLLVVTATVANGNGIHSADLLHGVWDVTGALLLGFAIGIPMSVAIGRYSPGEPTVVEIMGFIFICGGLALYLDISYLLACMTLGATVARRAQHVKKPFHAIEKASEPFLIVFFILSGMSLDLASINTLSALGVTYIIARSIGKVAGARLAAHVVNAPPQISRYLGGCLLPQAGVAIGMALLVSEKFPDVGQQVLALTVASTVLFELFGPIVARWSLIKADECSSEG